MSKASRQSTRTPGAAPASANPPAPSPAPVARPRLVVIIDTEEEFDWEAPFDRGATSVESVRHIGRCQRIFDDFGVHPVYVVDFPVASQPAGFEPVREVVESGGATVGAHLHPWVSPPFDEVLSRGNSFAGNLPRELERAKLSRLADEIERSFGARPLVYKAGRYGFGPRTAEILVAEGFEVDVSWCPPFDFSAEGGPDYSTTSCHPRWLDDEHRLLEIPCTGAWVGLLSRHAGPLGARSQRPLAQRLKLPALLSRSGLLERLFLSPEGYTLRELVRLTRHLCGRGLRLFTLSFHSPSLEPGNTGYVRDRAELDTFLDTLRGYLEFFLGELGGRATTPLEVKRRMSTARAA